MLNELYEQGFALKESRIHLKSDKKEAIAEALKDIKNHRKNLVDYIKKHPEFQHALKPITVPPEAPEIVQSMAEDAKKSGSWTDGCRCWCTCGPRDEGDA